ncbi:MAG TPA: hypothetical protein ENN79_02365 [Desulfobacteraceae bacterium]|nr:hypothetical protein [Desulfobacteraceae bacterium]
MTEEPRPNLPRIPGCRLERLLARGGMAEVYLAVQQNLNRRVAVKILSPALFSEPGFTQRFYQEATTAAALQHPGIVSVHDVGSHEGKHYIVMEYLPRTLKGLLTGGSLEPETALRIFRTVASALDHAHARGFVHRDVKPDNILLREDGSAVLADFGISRAVAAASRLTRTGMSIGTPHYMSPEQAQGLEVDGSSDLYSLGVVLFEMLHGATPFRGENPVSLAFAHVQQPIPELPPHLAGYQPLVAALMAKNPRQRPRSGEAAVTLLAEIDTADAETFANAADNEAPSTISAENALFREPTAVFVEPSGATSAKSRRLVAGLSLTLLAFLVLLGVHLLRRDQMKSSKAGDATPAIFFPSLRQDGATAGLPESENDHNSGKDQQGVNAHAAAAGVIDVEWIEIPSGTFLMGADDGETDERPRHSVYLDAYRISRCEITFDQYDAFCDATGKNKPSDEGWGRNNRPVINVSWQDARSFCSWLSKESGLKIDLPTEAQWERACGSGNNANRVNLEAAAWFLQNSGSRTRAVGQKAPMQSGVRDMLGNVEEWCRDWYAGNFYQFSPRVNPLGPGGGTMKVTRGGSFFSPAGVLRPAYRNSHAAGTKEYYLGFRVVSEVQESRDNAAMR